MSQTLIERLTYQASQLPEFQHLSKEEMVESIQNVLVSLSASQLNELHKNLPDIPVQKAATPTPATPTPATPPAKPPANPVKPPAKPPAKRKAEYQTMIEVLKLVHPDLF